MPEINLGGWQQFPQNLFIPTVIAKLGNKDKSIVITYDTGAQSEIALDEEDQKQLGVESFTDENVQIGPLSTINNIQNTITDGQIISDQMINMDTLYSAQELEISNDNGTQRMSISYQLKLQKTAVLNIHGNNQIIIEGYSKVGNGTPYPSNTTFYSTDITFVEPNTINAQYTIATQSNEPIYIYVDYGNLQKPIQWDTGAGYNTIKSDIAYLILKRKVYDGEKISIPTLTISVKNSNNQDDNLVLKNVPFIVDDDYPTGTLGAPIFAKFQQMYIFDGCIGINI